MNIFQVLISGNAFYAIVTPSRYNEHSAYRPYVAGPQEFFITRLTTAK